MSLIAELKRRNVFRMAVLYAVSSWLILQVADVLAGLFGLPEWTLRFVGFLLLLGFPVALVFSWVYELTPEGLKLEKHIDRSDTDDEQSTTYATAHKLDVAVIALLVVAMGLFVVDRFIGEPSARTIEPIAASADTQATEIAANSVASEPESISDHPASSVAVLPFVNTSPDADQEFFSDGLSDTLIHVLAQIRDLKVAARTSSFAFKGEQADVREIAEKLGVATILEGSVQKAGNQLRIIAQLIDASDVDSFVVGNIRSSRRRHLCHPG